VFITPENFLLALTLVKQSATIIFFFYSWLFEQIIAFILALETSNFINFPEFNAKPIEFTIEFYYELS